MAHPSKPRTIVVGLDGSVESARALWRALRMLAGVPGGKVQVVSVVTGLDPMGRMHYAREARRINLDKEREALGARVGEVLESYRNIHGEPNAELQQHVLIGNPAEELNRAAAHYHADLLVVGTHGRKGLQRLMVGSVAEMVLRQAPCPVLVVRKKEWPRTLERFV